MPRPSRALILTIALLLVAALLDRFLLPNEFLAIGYVVPILLAAQTLSPRTTALVGAVALAVATLGIVLVPEHLGAPEVHLLFLVVVAVQGYLIAARIRDVEERDRSRRRLQNFLGMVAHDLRNPLTVVLGQAQTIVRPTISPEYRERAAAAIQAQARRMDRLIGDLVDAARIGAGSFQVQPQTTDLVALACRVVEEQQATTSKHHIEVEAPDHLMGDWDPDRLTQVMINLLSNAIKYSPDGGEIRVQLRPEREQVVIGVSDQGVGIGPEALPTLFQPFSRAYAQQRTYGAGLGLYITWGIVNAHGGRISVASAGPNKGSTFTVRLPWQVRSRSADGDQTR